MKRGRIFIIVLLVFVVVTGFWLFKNPIKNTFLYLTSPITKTFWKIGDSSSSFLVGFFNAKTLRQENERLLNDNFALLGEIAKIDITMSENQALYQALDIKAETEFELLPAQTVLKTISRDTIFINQGKGSGIKKGMPVITESKVLLGRVTEVLNNFSRVDLISTNSFVFDVIIQGETSDSLGALTGRGNQQLSLDLVPKKDMVLKNNTVVTSVLGGNFPEGILVGVIQEIKKTDAEAFQKGTIDPYFKQNDLSWVFVITNFRALVEQN